METTTGGQPPTAATPAAPAASSSTVQVQQDLGTKAKAATSPTELRALTEQLRQNQLKPVAPTPPAPVETAPVEETPAPEATTEQPQETEAPAEETPPAEAEATPETEETEDEGEGPVTPLTGKRAHLRLNESDEVGRLALAFQKRNRDLPLADCIAAAQKQLGITPKQEAQAPAVTEDPKVAALPKSVAEVDTLTSQLLADYKKAMTEVRFEDAADAQAKLMQLTQHRSTLERRAETEKQEQAAKYDSDFTKSEAQAVDLYPFAADPASAGAKRMAQIEATMLKNSDPAYYSPNKPLLLAQMVAAELKIAPRNKNAAPAKAAAPVVPVQKKGVLPTGGSRTVPVTNTKPPLVQAVGDVKSVHDLRKVLRSVGVQT